MTARLKVIAAMVIFGSIGLLRRSCNLPSGFLACGRGLIGAAFMWLLYHGQTKRPQGRTLWLLILSGCLIGLNWVLLFEAYNHTSITSATMCYYLAPLIAILLAALCLKEPLRFRQLLCVILTLIGASLTADFSFSQPFFDKGIIFALLAALFYGTVIVLNRFIKAVDGRQRTIIQLFFAGLITLPYSLFSENWQLISFAAFPALLIMGILHTGIAYALYFSAIEQLNTFEVGLLSYLDPLVAVLISVFVLQELLSFKILLGIVMMLTGLFFLEV